MATETPLELGIIGLGRMGGNIARRLLRDGHRVVGHNRTPEPVADTRGRRRNGSRLRSTSSSRCSSRRAPSGSCSPRAGSRRPSSRRSPTQLEPGDTIIDGGNTHYADDIRRAGELETRGIDYLDCGTSGGIFGLERGFCLMIGGPESAFDRLEPIFASLAPGIDAAPRGRGRSGEPTAGEHGYLHCGGSGAGHFVKMVHNGIEYGLMAAYAEGFDLLRHAGVRVGRARGGRRDRSARASRALHVRARPGGDRGAVAARQRRLLLAARPDLRGAPRLAGARRLRRPRLGLRRRPLDLDRSDRHRYADPRSDHGALLALHVARRGRLRESVALRASCRVRRARRKAPRDASARGAPRPSLLRCGASRS